jgi:hypothetical protein
MPVDIKDIDGVYGALNNIDAGTVTPVADRRDTSPTSALLKTIESIYTPDALRNKNQFRGLVLFSKPSTFPLRSSKDAYFEGVSVSEANSPYQALGSSHYYYYYVLIPEIEPRPIDFDDQASIAKRMSTFDLVYMTPQLVQEGQNKRITPGTQVTVQFENMETLTNPVISNIGPLLFSFDITGLTPDKDFPYGRTPTLVGMVGRDGDHLDPKGNSGMTSAAHAHLAEPKYTPDDIKKCADKYDSDSLIGGRYRKTNDVKISLLNPEAQPFCKCFIVRCHEQKITIRLNSTTRTTAWQAEHRRWYIEGDNRQKIFCAKAWGVPPEKALKVVRGTSDVVSWKYGGSWHQSGFAWDFNPTITMPDGTTKLLKNASASNLWDTSGIGEIAKGLGLYWGGGGPTGRDIDDQIHIGGQSIVKRLTDGKLNKGYKVLAAESKQGAPQGGLDFDKWKEANSTEPPS